MTAARINRWLLLAALLVGAGLRLWRLDALPAGLYHDEAYNGLDALVMSEGGLFPIFHEAWELYAADAHADNPAVPTRFPVFFEGNYGREPVHIYLMSLGVRLLGNSVLAVRLVPALGGILGIWTTWLAAGALLRAAGRRGTVVPGAAAVALAIIFPAVHFSRFGLRVMLFVPVSTLCVYFFWRGVAAGRQPARGGWLAWLMAGFFLGLPLYVYAAGRLFPLLFALFVPVWFWLDPSARRRFWRPVALMAGTALATALPLLIFFARYPYFFFFRIAYVANRGQGVVAGRPLLTWLANVPRVLAGFFWSGETHFRHNLPGRPFLDAIQAALFLTGAWQVVRRWREPERLFLTIWFAVMLLPSILSGDAPHFGRLTGALPPTAILIGLGVEAIGRRFDWRRPLVAALAALALVSTAWTTADYFSRYAGHPLMAVDFYQDDWRLGQVLAAAGAEVDLYFTPTQEEMATIFFALGNERDHLHSLNLDQTLLAAGRPGMPALYAVHDRSPAALDALREAFPKGEIRERVGPYALFYLPAAAPRMPDGVDPSSAVIGGKIALDGWSTRLTGGAVEVTLVWRPLEPLPTGYTAFVHLLDGRGEIIGQQDRPPAGYPTVDWRTGEIISDRFTISRPANLPADWALRTGFYDPVTLQPLGEPVILHQP